MKKITSMFLALVMALALAVPAFASSGKVDVAGSITLPTINVVLPTTASMILNPYGLEVKLNPKDTTEEPVTDQIISPIMQVKNLSDIGMKVDIKVNGTVGKGGTAEFTDEDPTATTGAPTGKVANVVGYFAIIGNDDVADFAAPASMTIGTTPGTVQVLPVDETDDTVGVVKGFEPATAADEAGRTNVLAPSKDKKTTNDEDKGILAFLFTGSAVKAPTKTVDSNEVSDPWTDKDVLSASVSFTFTPVPGDIVETTP